MNPTLSSSSAARNSLRIDTKTTLRIPVPDSSFHIDLLLSISIPKCLFKTNRKMRIPKTLTVSFCFSLLYSTPSRFPQFSSSVAELGFCSSRKFFSNKSSQGVYQRISGEFTLRALNIYTVALCSFSGH